jgi:hypothetical protein
VACQYMHRTDGCRNACSRTSGVLFATKLSDLLAAKFFNDCEKTVSPARVGCTETTTSLVR